MQTGSKVAGKTKPGAFPWLHVASWDTECTSVGVFCAKTSSRSLQTSRCATAVPGCSPKQTGAVAGVHQLALTRSRSLNICSLRRQADIAWDPSQILHAVEYLTITIYSCVTLRGMKGKWKKHQIKLWRLSFKTDSFNFWSSLRCSL